MFIKKTFSDLRASWKEKDAYLNQYFDEVSSGEFYRFIFPSESFEREDHYEDHKANGFMIGLTENKEPRKRIIHDDLLAIETACNRYPTVFISPVSYYGNRNTLKNARYAYALTFDLDNVEYQNLRDVVHQASKIEHIPKPTFLVNSGTGVHLYYVFKEPVALYPNAQILLKELKKRLIDKIWNGYISQNPKRQYQGITQGYRVIGSQSKLGSNYPVKGYWYENGDRVTLEELNEFLNYEGGFDLRVNLLDIHYKSKQSLEEAKKMYSDWYERRIVNGEVRRTWNCKRALYDWWLNKIRSDIVVGHRYHSIIALASYAKKCEYDAEKNKDGVTQNELERDAFSLINFLDRMTDQEDNHFTEDDVIAALKVFDEKKMDGKTSKTFTREYISNMTGVRIEKNKRNGRKQADHLLRMRTVQKLDYPNGEWRNKEGKPKGSGTKKQLIKDYVVKHPETKISDIAKELGISRTTVYKYYDEIKGNEVIGSMVVEADRV